MALSVSVEGWAPSAQRDRRLVRRTTERAPDACSSTGPEEVKSSICSVPLLVRWHRVHVRLCRPKTHPSSYRALETLEEMGQDVVYFPLDRPHGLARAYNPLATLSGRHRRAGLPRHFTRRSDSLVQPHISGGSLTISASLYRDGFEDGRGHFRGCSRARAIWNKAWT